MTWAIQATGNAEEVGKAFDAERERSAANGMIEPELLDITKAMAFAVDYAGMYDRVTVSANGSWYTFTADDVLSRKSVFDSVSIRISAAPAEATATPPTAQPE